MRKEGGRWIKRGRREERKKGGGEKSCEEDPIIGGYCGIITLAAAGIIGLSKSSRTPSFHPLLPFSFETPRATPHHPPPFFYRWLDEACRDRNCFAAWHRRLPRHVSIRDVDASSNQKILRGGDRWGRFKVSNRFACFNGTIALSQVHLVEDWRIGISKKRNDKMRRVFWSKDPSKDSSKSKIFGWNFKSFCSF